MKLGIVSKNKYKIVFALLAIFSVFVCLSCISAADSVDDSSLSDAGDIGLDDSSVSCDARIPCFTMAARFNSGTGYHWEISPETYGATFMTSNKILDHPGACGSSGTVFFNFFIPNKHDFYIKLVEIAPNGNVVDVKEAHSF